MQGRCPERPEEPLQIFIVLRPILSRYCRKHVAEAQDAFICKVDGAKLVSRERVHDVPSGFESMPSMIYFRGAVDGCIRRRRQTSLSDTYALVNGLF